MIGISLFPDPVEGAHSIARPSTGSGNIIGLFMQLFGKQFIASVLCTLGIPEFFDLIHRTCFAFGKEQVMVLLYHRVCRASEDWELEGVDPVEFEKQLVYLKRHYHLITLDQFIDALLNGFDRLPKKHGRRFVVVTFDDGYKDNFTNAYPLLKKYEVPATFYVSTGYVDPIIDTSALDRPMARHTFMSWNDLHVIANDPLMSIGAHTVTHPHLTNVSIDDVQNEMRSSKQTIEEKLGRSIATFAYPFGLERDFSPVIIDLARECGFTNAPTAIHGLNDATTSPFEIKRIVAGFTLETLIVRMNSLYLVWYRFLEWRLQRKNL